MRPGPSQEVTVDPSAPLGAGIAADRLRAVYDIGRTLLEERDPSRVVSAVQSAIVSHLKPDRACVLARADGSHRALAAHGFDLSGAEDSWPLSRTVLQRVRESGLALLAADVSTDAELDAAASVQKFRIRSVMCVPLGRQPVRGLVYLDRKSASDPFTKSDLEFLSAVSGYAALVIERANEQMVTAEALRASDERLELLQGELLRHQIVGRSAALLQAYDAVRRFAAAGARVLLRGETGTGKELFARVYAANTSRSGGPYVPVPIPALSPTVIESELFGHVRGAFTEAVRDKKGRLEVADRGVLFLDEIGDVAPDVQVKLLRFLDSGELVRVGETHGKQVDTLIVSATNRPLEKDTAEGRMRHDLLARLGHTVVLPPLRERRDDIPLLLDHYLEAFGGRARRKVFSPEAIALLQQHDWPFNVRELKQVVERSVCLSDHGMIGVADLPPYIGARDHAGQAGHASPLPAAPATDGHAAEPRTLRAIVEEAERAHIIRTLSLAAGNRRRAAEMLGVSPDTLYRRLKDLGIATSEE